jgi:predicted ATPase/DNA-binding SARP family transcriptional activator
VRFRDLGPLQLQIGDVVEVPRGRRLTAILSTLLLHLGRRVSVDLLLDAVWGDEATSASVGTLESHIWRLRRLLEPARQRGEAATVLLNDSGGYRLVATPSQVDSARLEQLNLEVLDLLTTGQGQRALEASEQARHLWRGEPFVELIDRPWASGPIARLTEIWNQLQERRVDALLAVGREEQAVSELEPLLSEYPFREHLWWLRMMALVRIGRTDDALTTFRAARRTLIEGVGLEPGPELAELHRRILGQDPTLRREPAPQPTPPALPLEIRLPRPRSVLGRVPDMHRVAELLLRSRLVTITGAAGCGKTLLAVESARGAAQHYPDGVRFVDLSSAEPGDTVADIIAASLTLPVAAGSTAASSLVDYGRDRRALLLLDNCEQVLDQIEDLAQELTDAGRQLSLLLTSREPVGLENELVHVVVPLPVRAPAATPVAYSAVEEPAVALFLARARIHEPSQDELVLVRSLCRALDGIPLAIELAAALASAFSLVEILDQVERDPGQLAAIGRGQAQHHQTLQTAIERSHRLLSNEEHVLHRRLSVLPGSFDRRLADAVAGPELGHRAAPVLARLVHRSLLSASHSSGGTRFAQLAPVRAHAVHCLGAAGELDLAADLRDEWIRDLVRSRPPAGRLEEAAWYAALDDELPTLRATLTRNLVHRPRPLGASVAPQLVGLWYYRDLNEEGVRWCEAAATQPWDDVKDQVITKLALADLLAKIDRADRARATADAALTQLRIDGPGVLRVDGPAGELDAAAQRHVTESLLSLTSSLAMPRDSVTMRRLLDFLTEGELLLDEDLRLVHESLTCLADLITGVDVLDRLDGLFRRADDHGNLWAAWMTGACGASTGLIRRDPQLGMLWSRRVVDRQGRLGATTVVSQVETYGDFLALDGRLADAVRIFAATRHQSRLVGRNWPRNPLTAELLERCRTQLATEEFDTAWIEGPTMSREQLTR